MSNDLVKQIACLTRFLCLVKNEKIKVVFTLLAQISLMIPFEFSQMNWIEIYLALSLPVAGLVAYESVVLYKNKGKLAEDSWIQIISLLDLVWLVVSGFALYYLDLNLFEKVVPSLFIIYNVFGWGYSTYLLKDQLDMDNIDKISDITIPKAYIDYSMSFALLTILLILTLFAERYL